MRHKVRGRRREFIKRAAAAAGLSAMVPAPLRAAFRVALPAEPLRTSRLIDGALWTGSDPEKYAEAHAVRV